LGAVVALAAVCAVPALSAAAAPHRASAGTTLVGTFTIEAGANAGSGAPTGSYFRMIDPGGSIASGPFFSNPYSASTAKTYTLIAPGTAGGLKAGSFQRDPKPAFSKTGAALAKSIIAPTNFAGINFSAATDPKDPQTGTKVPAPQIVDNGGVLTGQVTAWSASWNKLHFNQGSPKPDGSSPGLTSPVTGTYDPATRTYTLSWASEIVGGPFNGFTGYWHLTGTFKKR
jgi:hypothetical protein